MSKMLDDLRFLSGFAPKEILMEKCDKKSKRRTKYKRKMIDDMDAISEQRARDRKVTRMIEDEVESMAEWANTPDGYLEEPVEFKGTLGSTADLSLRRYLKAKGQPVSTEKSLKEEWQRFKLNEDNNENKNNNIRRIVKLVKDGPYGDQLNQKKVIIDNIKRDIRIFGNQDSMTIEVIVKHNGDTKIYGDSGFEKEISRIIGVDVMFSEEDLQKNNRANLEGILKNKKDLRYPLNER